MSCDDALNEFLREVEEYLACHGDRKAEMLRIESRGWRVKIARTPPTTAAPVSESAALLWKPRDDIIERQVAWIDRDARHVAVVVKGQEYLLTLPPLPTNEGKR